MDKKCSNKKCLLEKDISLFCLDKNRNDGLNPWCKECVKSYKNKYRKNNKKKINEYNKKYIQKKRLDQDFCNKENIQTRKYYINNKYKINKQRNIYQKNRRGIDMLFKLKQYISNNIKSNFKNNNKKLNGVWKILPYTPQQLKEQLESLFEPWMTWENYGKASLERKTWNIEHIIPQDSFDFFNETEIRKCWDLSNLRPYDAIENIKKGNKIING